MNAADLLKEETLGALLHVLNPEPDCTRVVGGAVRNALLGEEVLEIDLATKLTPDRVTELGKAAGYNVVPTGIEFGTVTVVVDKRPFEVTTLREDIETDGRHAKVKFGTSWETDASRRDFTINALYLDADGKVHAPVGGLDDLKARRVRFIGDAKQRIMEDYLRIWRFFRFSAQIAQGNFDADGIVACLLARDGLKLLSAERVKQELFKLLLTPHAADACAMMSELGLTIPLLGVQHLRRLKSVCDYDARIKKKADAVERLAALCLWLEEDAARLGDRLKLSRAETKMLTEIAQAMMHLREKPDEKAARALCYRLPHAYQSAVIIASGGVWSDLLAVKSPPEFPVKGADLIRLGYQPGEKLGALLKALEQQWIESDFAPSREELLKGVKNP